MPLLAEHRHLRGGVTSVLDHRERPPDAALILWRHVWARRNPWRLRPECRDAAPSATYHVLDHGLEAESHPVFGVIDPLDTVRFQYRDLIQRHGAAASAKDPDVAGTSLTQAVDHV